MFAPGAGGPSGLLLNPWLNLTVPEGEEGESHEDDDILSIKVIFVYAIRGSQNQKWMASQEVNRLSCTATRGQTLRVTWTVVVMAGVPHECLAVISLSHLYIHRTHASSRWPTQSRRTCTCVKARIETRFYGMRRR